MGAVGLEGAEQKLNPVGLESHSGWGEEVSALAQPEKLTCFKQLETAGFCILNDSLRTFVSAPPWVVRKKGKMLLKSSEQ
jgi:hypothetical protein